MQLTTKVKTKESPVATPEEQEQWKKFWQSLDDNRRHTIETETAGAKDALVAGSKFALGRRFATIRKTMVPRGATHASEKEAWGLYLKVYNFSGLATSSLYVLMDSVDAAEKEFHRTFLDALERSAISLFVTPSPDHPLGKKYTAIARNIPEIYVDDLSTEQAQDLVNRLAIKAKEKPDTPKKPREEQEIALADSIVKRCTALTKKYDNAGDDPSSEQIEAEITKIMAHIYHAAGATETVEIEPEQIKTAEQKAKDIKTAEAQDAAIRRHLKTRKEGGQPPAPPQG